MNFVKNIIATSSLILATGQCVSAAPSDIKVIIDLPDGPGPFPAVIFAPGQGYHMSLPLMQEAATKMVQNGIAVYRFNWRYFTKDPKTGEPSEDLSAEFADMTEILNLAREEKRVHRSKIFLAGKSLGSLVAWRVFKKNPDISAVALLTPVCNNYKGDALTPDLDLNYPGSTGESRSISFILGDHDPICKPTSLYGFAKYISGPVRISVIGGNHGFDNANAPEHSRPGIKKNNIELASTILASFISDISR